MCLIQTDVAVTQQTESSDNQVERMYAVEIRCPGNIANDYIVLVYLSLNSTSFAQHSTHEKILLSLRRYREMCSVSFDTELAIKPLATSAKNK